MSVFFPHYDLGAEAIVLGTALLKPNTLHELGFLFPEQDDPFYVSDPFYSTIHSEFFAAARSLAKNGCLVDAIALIDYFGSCPGEPTYESIIEVAAAGTSNREEYDLACSRVVDCWRHRMLSRIALDVHDRLTQDDCNVVEIARWATGQIDYLMCSTKELRS